MNLLRDILSKQNCLNSMVEGYNFKVNDEVIRLSQELDVLIVEYHRRSRVNQTGGGMTLKKVAMQK